MKLTQVNKTNSFLNVERYVSKQELKDVLILAIAYGMLEYDSKGTYINNSVTEDLKVLNDAILNILGEYRKYGKKIMTMFDEVQNRVNKKNPSVVTTPQVATSLLSLNLPSNERKDRILAEPLKDFWVKYKDVIQRIEDAANEEAHTDTAVSAVEMAYEYINTARGL